MEKQSHHTPYVHGIDHLDADVCFSVEGNTTRPSYYFLKIQQVLQYIPVSKSSWYSGVKRGIYPKGYSLGGRLVAWRSCDIEDLLRKLGGKV